MIVSRWIRVMLFAIILSAALPIAGVAAQDATPAAGDTTCAPATDAETEALARAWIEESLAAGNPDALDEIQSPDVVHHAPDFSVTLDGDAVKGFHQGLINAFPDATYAIDLIVTEAPWAVLYLHTVGQHDGEFQGLAPTGQTVAWVGINVFRVECGQIVESWSAVDEAGRLAQLQGDVEADQAVATMDDHAAALASPAACPAPDRAEAEAALTALIADGWGTGDEDAIASVVSEDVREVRNGVSGTSGADDLIAGIKQQRGGVSDFNVDLGPVIVDGEYAAAFWSSTGTDSVGLLGFEPSGRDLHWDGVTIIRYSCGEITEIVTVSDVLGLRNQLGAE